MISSDLKCFSRHDLAFTKSESDACRVNSGNYPRSGAKESLPYREQPDQQRAALHHVAPGQASQ